MEDFVNLLKAWTFYSQTMTYHVAKNRIMRLYYHGLSNLKLSRNKKNLNDVTAAPFLVSFFQLPAAKRNTDGAAVTSLRSFLFRDKFKNFVKKNKCRQSIRKVINFALQKCCIIWHMATHMYIYCEKIPCGDNNMPIS